MLSIIYISFVYDGAFYTLWQFKNKERFVVKSVNLMEKFGQVNGYWRPHLVAEANGQHVRLAKLKNEFVWHSHEQEDELFIVIKGTLTVHFRDRDEIVKEGELLVIPKGVEHMPEAQDEVLLVNITKAETTHTGDTQSDMTVKIDEMPRL
ncbi:MAG: mannose-6-phosphate isomerase-like protein (cupin superfamily) [Sneathiella sp.]|jgi:mannose-6-phosphate isomerase-like protein (cupin superfamily)